MNDFLEWTRLAFRHLYADEALPPVLSDPQPVQEDVFFRLACRHRVMGLWSAAGIAPAWKRHAYGQTLSAARCAAEAERIYGHLAPRIPLVGLIKGPALAVQAWSQSGLRHYDDLDFRCGKKDIDNVSSALKSLGYEPEIADKNHQLNLWHFGWGVAFVNGDGLRIEINHRLFPPHYPSPRKLELSAEGGWTQLTLDQRDVLTLAPSAHLLYSSMHAIWHGWERLSWIVDIAGLMMRHPGILVEARQLAGESGFPRRALDAACCVADRLFGPLPVGDGTRVISENQLDKAVILLLQSGDCAAGTREWQRQLCSQTEWLGSTWRRLITPGDPDFRRWSLNAQQRYRYWLLRPLRIAAASLNTQ